MKIIAGFIDKVIQNMKDDDVLEQVRKDVKALCDKFPLYSERKK
jgi:glycine/serine hydroxymethyltransferase